MRCILMFKYKFLAFFCFLFLIPAHAVIGRNISKNFDIESTASFQANSRLAADVDNYLTNAEAHGYSGIVLWAKDGKIILKKGYGFADRSAGVPMKPRTVFDMGSVTKMFTAAAILKLEEKGKLSVNDSISKIFNDLPADKAEITIHHLLSQTSGFPLNTDGNRAIDYDLIERDDFVKRVLNSDLLFPPGKEYRYSNDGYGLLTVIIEKTSGMPYEAFLNREIFKPAGMNKTGYQIPRWNKKDIARGYRYEVEHPTPLGYPWLKDGPPWNLRGNGGLLTTVEDLYKWHLALEGEAVLSKASKAKMFAPYAPRDKEGKQMYGYGWWMTTTAGGIPEIAHSGGNDKFATWFRRYPTKGTVIITVTNHSSSPAYRDTRNLHNWILEEKVPEHPVTHAKISRSQLGKFAGTYELSSGKKFDIKLQKEGLAIDGDAAGISAGLTLPEKLDAERSAEFEKITARVISGLAKQNYQPLYDVLWRDIKPEEEEAFWRAHWKYWVSENGEYVGSKVIGARTEKDILNVFVTIQFEKGKEVVSFQKNAEGRFFVNVSSNYLQLIPRLYWLSSKSPTEFIAYNFELKKGCNLKFQASGKKSVSGVDIVCEGFQEFAKKIN